MINERSQGHNIVTSTLLTLVIFLLPGTTAWAENQVSSVEVLSMLDFNAILITEVDVVFVYDQQLAAELADTKGGWYSQKYNLTEDQAAALDQVTISVPQGFNSANVNIPERSATAIRVFAAAYHESQSTPIHDLTELNNVLIQIDEFGIVVSEKR
jgi:hypothetical protein